MDDFGYPSPPWRKKFNAESIDETRRAGVVGSNNNSFPPKPKKYLKKNHLVALAVVVVVLVVGIFALSSSSTTSSRSKLVSSKTSTRSARATTQPVAVATQSLSSTSFNLSLNYPDGWKVVNAASGPLTVTSPPETITSADGKKVTGLVTLTVWPASKTPSGFSSGQALAVLNSQNINYTQPTTSQNAQAYISFVQYSTTNTKGGLDGVFLTGNYGYQQDQTIAASDIANVSPLVTVTFAQCGNSSCTTNISPLTIAASSWSGSSFNAPIMSMLESLAFQ